MLITEEQAMVRDMARQFAAERLAPYAAEWDRTGQLPGGGARRDGALGLLGMVVPEEWGGAGPTTSPSAGAGGDRRRRRRHLDDHQRQQLVGCADPDGFGTTAQKERWLQPLARGEMLGAFCLTEPHVGSRCRRRCAPRARARRRRLRAQRRQAVHHQRQERRRRDRHGGHRQGRRQEGHQRLPRADRHARLHASRGSRTSSASTPATPRRSLFEDCRVPADQPARRGGRGLQDRAVRPRRRAHRHRRAGGRHGARRVRGGARLRQGAREPSASRSSSTRRCSFRLADMATQIEAARQLILPRRGLQDAGRAVPEGSGDGQAVRQRDGRAGLLATRSRSTAATATSATSRSSASTATCASARSTKAPATSSAWSSAGRLPPGIERPRSKGRRTKPPTPFARYRPFGLSTTRARVEIFSRGNRAFPGPGRRDTYSCGRG